MAHRLSEIGSLGKGGPEVPEKIVTGDDYLNSLHDRRRVYCDGSVVEDLGVGQDQQRGPDSGGRGAGCHRAASGRAGVLTVGPSS